MDPLRAAQVPLVGSLAAAHWLRGDTIEALAAAAELDAERYKVRGLDEDGHSISTGERVADAIIDWDDAAGGGYVAVPG